MQPETQGGGNNYCFAGAVVDNSQMNLQLYE